MKNTALWLKTSVLNFFIVSVLGVLMRYKIAFSLPFVEQKHLQEAHSHFAFYGWITLAIYVLIINSLQKYLQNQQLKKYNVLFILNLVAAYIMLFAFLWKGYFIGSIIASALALLVSFVFFFFLIHDLKNINIIEKPWFLGGLFFAVLSSLGIFSLSYMMISKNINQDFYLASTYFYLHFQYNGFFIFSCIGLLMNSLQKIKVEISPKINKSIFWLMFIGCLVGYGLSVLWMKLPLWLFIIIVLATLAQTLGAFKLYQLVKTNWGNAVASWSPMQRFVMMYVGFAFFVKILLQLGSNIPAISQFTFGFRNIVIAYLHLVLLMCIAAFLINQILATQLFKINNSLLNSFKLLLTGIFLNELVLGLMGILSIKYISIPFAPYLLFAIAILMMISIFWMLIQMKKQVK